jgi:glycosyltransferase involved in cell wall biosynthesis
MKKLSIITVNYNNSDGLRKTIQSVKDQTFNDFEFILIDGGSTDTSLKVIQEQNSIINYWVSEPDCGVYHAMNKGIIKAIGEYCLFLNSGDFLKDNKVLENIFNKNINEDIIYGNAIKVKPHYRREIKYSPTLTLYDFYRTEPAMHHQATFIKRELFVKHGQYSEDIEIIADWEFFFRTVILKEVKTKYIDKTICFFDGTGASNTLNVDNPERIKANNMKESILKTHFPETILNDYKKLDKILSSRSIWQKVVNKISFFRFKK